MSYILDALKRADAERERGAVPGLHTRQLTSPAAQAGPGARHRLWLAGAAALALGGAAAAGLWLWQKPAGTGRLAALESAVATPTPAVTPAPPIQPPAAPPSVSQPAAAPPRAVAPAPPAATRTAPRPEPKSEQKSEPKPVSKPAPPAPAVAKQAPPRPESVGPAAVPLLGDLSEDLRRQIPALAITGSVYSDNPALRLLLVNNQVLHPGAQAAPDVKLEEIRAKSSVFSYRGTRFRLAH